MQPFTSFAASWEWSYVGEAGEEIPVRNSHTSGIVREPNSGDNYLVVFGGASPEHGPLGDTYAAKLPKLEEIGGRYLIVPIVLLSR